MQPGLLLALLLPKAAGVPVTGSPECPCVDVESGGYGRGCAAHDINNSAYPQCMSDAPPGWCGDMWCYVNRSNCLVTNEVSISPTAPPAYWSYTTCGYRDLFSLNNITDSIRGQTLRVLFIGNTGGWKGNYCTDNGQICVNQRGYGPVQRILDSMTRSSGMGFVDICGCSMVMLPRRTDASPFLTLWTEPVVLVGPLRGNQGLGGDFGAMLGKAFRPLSPGLWGLAVVVALSMSFLITMFEKTEGGQFEDVEHGESFGSGLFMAFFSLVTFEVQFAPQTVGGRIVSLGLAFILILLVSGYTASLTSFLVVDNRLSSTVSDLNGAIRLGLKICAHRSDSVQLLLNGVKEENVVIQQSRSVVLPSVSEGACDLAVVRQEDLEASQAQNGGSFCQLTRIGDPVTTSMIGIAVSKKWSWALQYAMTSAEQEGLVLQAQSAYKPQDFCSAVAAEAEATAEPPSLQVEGMAGPFVLTSAIAGFGVLVHLTKAQIDKRRRGRKSQREKSQREKMNPEVTDATDTFEDVGQEAAKPVLPELQVEAAGAAQAGTKSLARDEVNAKEDEVEDCLQVSPI
ncbi:unnamed protein product [Effrenium voratum]|uniref:Ionotropic glutamate receptor C-terminal domain-containing protein n=1 Tax=Effrenium voratum TaxID=2562239 RepID=A0AA36JDR5_9DINO|nr:unnamed protein product [Effrenium voratum]